MFFIASDWLYPRLLAYLKDIVADIFASTCTTVHLLQRVKLEQVGFSVEGILDTRNTHYQPVAHWLICSRGRLQLWLRIRRRVTSLDSPGLLLVRRDVEADCITLCCGARDCTTLCQPASSRPCQTFTETTPRLEPSPEPESVPATTQECPEA